MIVIDMSPVAIDQRLRDVAQLYKLGRAIGQARRLGPVAVVESRSLGQAGRAD